MERESFGDVTHLALHVEEMAPGGRLWNPKGVREHRFL